jgi:hypothetical protein
MDSISLSLKTLVDPVGALPRAVEARKWLLPLMLVSALTAASGVAMAVKIDASRLVIPKMQMSGELAKASEREIDESVQQAQRVGIVAGVAKGLFVMPLAVLLLAVVVKLASWLLGRKVLFGACFTAAALATLPVAVLHGIEAVSALRQVGLTPAGAASLVPTSLAYFFPDAGPKLGRLYQSLDFINLWGALMLGLAWGAGAKVKPWQGALFGLGLYVLFACAFLIGGPGLAQGMGGPHP